MAGPAHSLTFGPVPSRRLGRSLGINTIPPKRCTYACVYCQLGRTPNLRLDRHEIFPTDRIVDAVAERLDACARAGERVDALTVVPDGEPTLDLRLGQLLAALHRFELPVAVITNGSLLCRSDVRDALTHADWVSVKVDAARETEWRRVNRPHGRLGFTDVLGGACAFAESRRGTLVTETMLVAGVNDELGHLRELALVLQTLEPDIAFVAVPTRPPAEPWVEPPSTDRMVTAWAMLRERLPRVELLTDTVYDPPARTGELEEDVLAITAVHPLDEHQLAVLSGGSGNGLEVAEQLVADGWLERTEWRGRRFYTRAVQ
jgi:wyosine [tRNA(Phe)-imidazoG37] synthetase (radical SAM superfamily)